MKNLFELANASHTGIFAVALLKAQIKRFQGTRIVAHLCFAYFDDRLTQLALSRLSSND